MEPWKCIAREQYERTRGLVAFNVTGATKVRKNQHAIVYEFADRSKFIVYGFGVYAYRGTNGNMYARRTDYSGYGTDPKHTVEILPPSPFLR